MNLGWGGMGRYAKFISLWMTLVVLTSCDRLSTKFVRFGFQEVAPEILSFEPRIIVMNGNTPLIIRAPGTKDKAKDGSTCMESRMALRFGFNST